MMTSKKTGINAFPSITTRFFLIAAGLLAVFWILGAINLSAQKNIENSDINVGGYYKTGIDSRFSPAAGEVDSVPNAVFDSYPGSAAEIVVQPDGKVLAAGYFKTVNGAPYKNIIRLNADLTFDPSFSAALNGSVTALALQTDGKILIGGSFKIVNGVKRNQVARLNADGSLDATFNAGSGGDNLVMDIIAQPDGKILVGGNFTGFGAAGNFGITRLNSDGSPDNSFVSPIPQPIPTQIPVPLTGIVYSIALQTDGKIVIGGLIIKAYNGTTADTTAVARLNADGSFDSSFNPGTINSNSLKVAIQPDGKILFAGFSTLVNGVSRRFIARLNPNGSLDAAFDPGTSANLPIYTMFLKADGKILIGGSFSTFKGVNRNRIAQLNADGTLDNSFDPTGATILGTAQNVTALPNGKVLAAGAFGIFSSGNNNTLKLFDASGAADTTFRFDTTAIGGVFATAVQPDGKILIGGNFTRVNGVSRNGIARLNADGSLDPNFGNFSGFVSTSTQINSVILQPDGKILIGGANIAIGNTIGFAVARLNEDGTNDSTFTAAEIPNVRGVNSMALQPDGKIVVVWGSPQTGTTRFSGGAVRLMRNGTLDSTFTLGVSALPFNSVALQEDGKILVGGAWSFGYVNEGFFYNGLIRLNADGSHDRDFVPALTSDSQNGRVTGVYAVTVQTDGKILVGGNLYTNSLAAATGLVRLNSNGTLDSTLNTGAISGIAAIARVEDIQVLPGGKFLVGGLFNNFGGAGKINAARLNTDGTIDPAFTADTDIYGIVYDVALQPNGKYLIAGDFEKVNGVVRTSLAGLLNEMSVRRTSFDFDGDGKADVSVFRPNAGAWFLNQSSAGFAGVNFGVSTDKLVPADYDGDGKTDVAVFRDGNWYLLRSSLGFASVQFGQTGDIPVPADFDGDGKAELAVYRNGNWYILNLVNNQFSAVSFGSAGDKPEVGDYDGDGKADTAVYRPAEGYWYLNTSAQGVKAVQFGIATDKAVPADYDGDGKTDVAVYRGGTWYILQSSQGFRAVQFGVATDLPVAADYDGDGKADTAVFRDGNWFILQSSNGFTGIAFGQNGDKPVPGVFLR